MLAVLQVVATMLVALAAVPSVAHALELPGKLYLDKQTYYAVQPIYYPGFTFAGFAEPAAILAIALLAWFTPVGTLGFWLVLIALAGMIAMHAIYWALIHPVNNFWIAGRALNTAGAAFFGFGSKREGWNPDWTELRDRWEYSHLARAIITSVSLLALVIALAI
jgi:hypothetical protein